MADELRTVLSALADAGRPVPGVGLKALANLSTGETATVQSTWRSLSPERRREAIGRLADLAEDNIDLNFDTVFVFCLEDPDPAVRRRAVDALWENEDRRLIVPLVRLLREDDDEAVRASAALALGRFVLLGVEDRLHRQDFDQVEAALLDAIADPGETLEVRRRSVEAIGASEHTKVPGIIEEAYHSAEPAMRISSLHAMGRSFDQRWLPVLIDELESEDAAIRYEAAAAIGELEAPSAVPKLIPLVDDPDVEVQASAILALGQIGGAVARQVLQRLLHHADERVRIAAEEALELLALEDNPLGLDLN